MKIKYEFATETIEVEVSEEMYALHMELDRVEYNNNHRETRRHVSLDTGLEHSDWLRSYDFDVYQQVAAEEDAARIRAAIDDLSESQKDLIQKIFDEGMSIKDYAAFCGVKPSAISHRIGTIRNNLKEILKKKREFPAIPIMSLTGNFILFITTTAFLS